jgi:hypothetical protein
VFIPKSDGRLRPLGLDEQRYSRVGRQRLPHLVRYKLRLLVCRESSLEDGECLAEAGGCWGEDAVECELVGGKPDTMARLVVSNLAHQALLPESDLSSNVGIAKVEYTGDLHLARQQSPGTDEFGTHSLDRLDKMPVRLNGDRIGRSA